MADQVLEPRSSFDDLTPTPAYIDIVPVMGIGQITLRADLGDATVGAAVQVAMGLNVPSALSVTHSADRRVVWMSPDELLLIMPRADLFAVKDQLDQALAGQHAMVLDASDTRATVRLTGTKVADVLAKGAPVDTSDHGFPPGTARRTHMAGLSVAIWRLDATTWEVVTFRSYAHHLWAWLHKAATPGSDVG